MSGICSYQERHALLKFKQSVKDDSKMLLSWVGNDCCTWERIYCDGVTGNVESLDLRGDMGYFSFYVRERLPRDGYHLVGDGFQAAVDGHYLVGNEVNPSLAELRHLKYLDLSGNDFGGSRIPEFVGSFKLLSYLNLSHAGFQGIIPPHIGNLSNLRVLDLSSNTEVMTDDIAWTFGLLSLEHLDLSWLDLGQAQNWDLVLYMIPTLKELSLSLCKLSNIHHPHSLNLSRILPNIRHLDLSFNSFEAPLPGFFQNMTSLTLLDLSNLNLSLSWNFANLLNTIPSVSELYLLWCGLDNSFLSSSHLNFSTLSNIQHLDLGFNSLEGVFPSVLSNTSSLKVLGLSGNRLNSSVPLMPNLLELDLSFNRFKQIDYVGIWRQCHLKQLSASNNHFHIEMVDSPKNVSECSHYALEELDLDWSLNGTIPESLGRMTNLRGLHLSGGRLTSPILESIRRLRFLEVLDLSHNELTGPIPTFLGRLSELDLSFNQLTGSIPESLGRLVSLQAISVSSNLLSGTIPVSIGQLAKLYSLDISYNSLEGIVFEAHFANLSMLKHLKTSYNSKLAFNVSREWIPKFQLVNLQLSSCNILNGFPLWLQNQRKLKVLVLSNVTISGPLPTWLQNMPIIPFLDLSHNTLSGPLTNLPNGGNFHVSGVPSNWALLLENNLFNGSIPRSLCNMTYLEYLDLSGNRLTGKIPNCLENLQNLLAMIFNSNQLSGVIPNSVALNSSSLRRLKLNDNNFIGELPLELGNIRTLRVLDLADNKFSGNIPEWIGEKLTSLVVLRLHKNNFTGRIPHSLCGHFFLQIVDVAYNSLTGTIPSCLGDLNAIVKRRSVYSLESFDSDENVIQGIKGVYLEYTSTWSMVFNMDLSSNKLVGEIPIELTALSGLIGLNLSNNHLSGRIPYSIGNMTLLESLDLSNNELIGMIPQSMTALTFLNHLNLSNNNLSGQIPTGNQLQTLIDPSIYSGNKDLCGPPLPNNCSNHEDPPTTPEKKYKAADEATNVWLLYADIMSGFATGFWGIVGVLLFKRQWRQKVFMFAEETMDKICVAVVIRVAKIKRGRETTYIPLECK